MLFIRPETKSDIEAIYFVNASAFKTTAEAELVDALRTNNAAVVSMVAELESKIVGHVLFSPVRIQTNSGEAIGLGLAPAAVLPEHQNQGIGTKLIHAALDECRKLDYELVIVLGHPNYYPRFGFQTASRFGIQLSFEVPDEAFMVLELQEGALERIQGTVHYRPEFEGV